MKTKKLILGSLFIGGILVIVRLLFAKLFNNSPSHDPTDTYTQEQMHSLVGVPG